MPLEGLADRDAADKAGSSLSDRRGWHPRSRDRLLATFENAYGATDL